MSTQKQPTQNLLSCPFCGLKAAEMQRMFDGSLEPLWFRVKCRHCSARSRTAQTEEKAAENWNDRVPF